MEEILNQQKLLSTLTANWTSFINIKPLVEIISDYAEKSIGTKQNIETISLVFESVENDFFKCTVNFSNKAKLRGMACATIHLNNQITIDWIRVTKN